MFKRFLPLLMAPLALAASCANLVQVKVDVVDQRTALENQVLGGYRDIEGDLALMASVRSIDSEGRLKPAPPVPEGKRAAIRAMQRSRFNQDDIERLKAAGAIGERGDGYLEFFEISTFEKDKELEKLARRMVAEENQDRRTLYERIAATGEGFEKGDAPKVGVIMAGLHRDAAGEGELVQKTSGAWVKKGIKK